MKALVVLLLWASLAQAATITVGPEGSIQAALFAAKSTDTILVQEGRYYEHLQVNKAVTLRGIGMPVLDATSSGSAITLRAEGITVEGFKIINAGSWPTENAPEAGIKILSSGNRIAGNDVSYNFNGIFIQKGQNNTISGNLVQGNLRFGIHLEGAGNNRILNNSLVDNRQNAFDDGLNNWTKNYYSDYDNPGEGCTDRGDGFCLAARPIPGGQSADERPRVRPVQLQGQVDSVQQQ